MRRAEVAALVDAFEERLEALLGARDHRLAQRRDALAALEVQIDALHASRRPRAAHVLVELDRLLDDERERVGQSGRAEGWCHVRLRLRADDEHVCSCSAPAAAPVWRQHFCLALADAARDAARPLRVELWWSRARAGPDAGDALLAVGEVALPPLDAAIAVRVRCALEPARHGCLELELTARALAPRAPTAAAALDALGFPIPAEHAGAHARACAASDADAALAEWNALVRRWDARDRALGEADAAAARALAARSGGVPLAHRAEVWRRALGADDGPDGPDAVCARYAALVREADRRESSGLERALRTAEQIRRDLPRTFPAHGAFGAGAALSAALGRALRALAVDCPAVGYCQSLNFVGALLLLLADEPRAFGLLRALCRAGLPDYWTESLEGVTSDAAVLADALARALPAVVAQLRRAGVPLELVLTRWLLCGCANLLPAAAVLALWDRLCLQAAARAPSGALALFEAAAALLHLARDALLRADDPSRALGALGATGASLYDPRPLLAAMGGALCATDAARDALHAARVNARAQVVGARYEALAARARLPHAALARAHGVALARLRLPACAIDHAVGRAELGALLAAGCADDDPDGAAGARELGGALFGVLAVGGDPLGDDTAALLAGGHATVPLASAVVVLVAAARREPVGIVALCFDARATDGAADARALRSAGARALLRELEAAFGEAAGGCAALPIDEAVAALVGDGVARWTAFGKLLERSGVRALAQRRLDGLRCRRLEPAAADGESPRDAGCARAAGDPQAEVEAASSERAADVCT